MVLFVSNFPKFGLCGEAEEKKNIQTDQVFLVVWAIPKIIAPTSRKQA